MYRIWIYLLFAAVLSGAPDDSTQILRQIREKVAAQLKKSANYTCVQTIDRRYFQNSRDLLEGCAYESGTPTRKEFMHDRLRLDVAVSEGKEIYSWHGENEFSSSNISDVVSAGPISSGGFIGFLENIFFSPGIQFSYSGKSAANGSTTYDFSYAVPLPSSRYHVHTKSGSPVVPFHGSFSAKDTDFQLAKLEIVADRIPSDSTICSADTQMNYQMVNISGSDSLLPALFILHTDDNSHIYTVSRNEYSQCREFRGEATLRFDDADAGTQAPLAAVVAKQWLPKGMTLHIALSAPLDEKTVYTGDPIQGVLLDPVKIPGSNRVIPKGAALTGLITKFEEHYEPEMHYYVRIEFRRLVFGNTGFLLRSSRKVSSKEGEKLYFLYGDPLPPAIIEQLSQGTMIFDTRHFRQGRKFSAEWETAKPPAHEIAVTAQK